MSDETEQREGESHHEFWLRTIHRLGGAGLFWAKPEVEELNSEWPKMLTRGADGSHNLR